MTIESCRDHLSDLLLDFVQRRSLRSPFENFSQMRFILEFTMYNFMDIVRPSPMTAQSFSASIWNRILYLDECGLDTKQEKFLYKTKIPENLQVETE